MKDVNSNDSYRFTRSTEGVFFGVCQGLADSFQLSVVALRILWLVSVLFFGVGLLFYFILGFSLPLKGYEVESEQPKVLGVCYRIHLKTGMEVGLVRAICLSLALCTFGATLVGYLVLHFVLPDLNRPSSF